MTPFIFCTEKVGNSLSQYQLRLALFAEADTAWVGYKQ